MGKTELGVRGDAAAAAAIAANELKTPFIRASCSGSHLKCRVRPAVYLSRHAPRNTRVLP
jgi:hypothetical protein